MSKQLRELQARKATLVKDARALTDIAAAEQRDMNDEEVAAFEALKARIEAASNAIDREAALIAEEAQMNHTSQLTTASVITVVDNAASDPKHGFKSVGDFLKTVRQAQNPGASIDERLLKKPPGRDDSRRCCGTRPTGRRREKSLHGGL